MADYPAELTGTWTVDNVHSTIGFAVRHAMVATTRGRFTSYTGGATIDADNIENSTLWLEIDASSVETGNGQRDGHLGSADFFNAEEHPKITYKSTSVKAQGDEVVVVGDLTVAGNTHPVEVTWEINGVVKNPMGEGYKAGFDGSATVNRKDWGLTWNSALEAGGVLVSDKIKLVLEIEADRA